MPTAVDRLPRLVGYAEIECEYGWKKRTLQEWCRQGKLKRPFQGPGGRAYWHLDDFLAFVEGRRQGLISAAVDDPAKLTPDQLADAAFDLAARHAAAIAGRPVAQVGIVATVELTADEQAARTAAMWDHMRERGPRHIGLQRSILAAFWLFPALRDVFRALKTVGPKLPPADTPEETICALGLAALDDERWKLATEDGKS